MEVSDSQIKTLLGTALQRHNTDLSEFVQLFIVSLCVVMRPIREVEKNPYEQPTCP